MIKVSIIVPIHNSAKYLHKCVDSCLAQTLHEIELILVDDCSQDHSPELIDAYYKKYPDRIVPVYLDKNVRQGGARNVGIEAAHGDYIAFVDSDDWIEPDMCEMMYQMALNNKSDMVGSNYFTTFDDSERKETLKYTKDTVGQMNSDKLWHYIRHCGMFWTRIYRREFLLENNLQFPEGIFYEDACFNFLSGLYAARIDKVEGCFYHYYQSPSSTVRSKNNVHQYERITAAQGIWDECQRRGLQARFHDIIAYKYILMMASNVLYTCFALFDEPDLTELNRIREAVRRSFPRFRKGKYYKYISVDLKIYFQLVMYSPALAVWVYRHRENGIIGVYFRLRSIFWEKKNDYWLHSRRI